MHLAETGHAPTKPEQVGVLVHQSPIEPADLVILAIGVVVTFLRATHLVASHERWNATREQEDGKKVANLTVAERVDVGIVRITLCATVPAKVVVNAVTVGLAVCLVMLLVVRDHIVEGKSVVTGHEVNGV